ncbi:MAG: HPr family phosphocarrier protein [Thermodesulfobacteriota bacterium]|nr:HPr family phosphocarrier protein [Thermodesulfobacteriota bacterium]
MTDKSLKEIISEDEFLKIAEEPVRDILRLCNYLKQKGVQGINKKIYGYIVTESKILEDFLDDYGTIYNKTWYYFRELIASIYTFGYSGYILEHTQRRYELDGDEWFAHFKYETIKYKAFFNDVLVALFKSIETEAKKNGLAFPDHKLNLRDFIEVPSNIVLPHNRNGEVVFDEKKEIIKISTMLSNIFKQFGDLGCYKRYRLEEIKELIPTKISEEKIRKFELKTHNLQSVYDTYIRDSKSEIKDKNLDKLRNYISISFHLFEIAGSIIHFFERHEKIISDFKDVIKESTLLYTAVNWALYYAHISLARGDELAKTILSKYKEMDTITIGIPKNLGFHLRPATLVAKIVNFYGSEVYMMVGDDKFNASSVLEITWAGGKISRENIREVTFIGDKRVLKDLKILAEVNYGEDIMGKSIELPKELSYLK